MFREAIRGDGIQLRDQRPLDCSQTWTPGWQCPKVILISVFRFDLGDSHSVNTSSKLVEWLFYNVGHLRSVQ